MREDVRFVLEYAVRFVADKVSHRVAFGHPRDGGVAHRPTPPIQESGFTGHIDDEVSEVGVVQGVAELPVALASAVGDGQVHPAVANFTKVGRGVVGGTDVPWDDLGHQQVLRGALVDVGFDGQLVLEQAELHTEVNLLAFFPLHVGVGWGGEGRALVQDLVLCAKRVAEDVFDAGHVAERGDAVRAVDAPRGAKLEERNGFCCFHEALLRGDPSDGGRREDAELVARAEVARAVAADCG